MKPHLARIFTEAGSSIYSVPEIAKDSGVEVIIASTPESRRICNDPFVTGIRYTQTLRSACALTFRALQESGVIKLAEADTTVLHILRGGLNFGLREALHEAFGWNDHASAFISAQRARKSPNSEDWIITESAYRKIHLNRRNNIVFGDVVATGTSLEFALQRLTEAAKKGEAEIESLVFFTIGGPRSHEILGGVTERLRKEFPNYRGSVVVYLEGIFTVATNATPLSIKFDGTDLIRTESVLALEFIESQYAQPSYPIERCTIYDAGSRAFDMGEYYHDVQDYWRKTQALAEQGMTFAQLLKERFSELDASRFSSSLDLKAIAAAQLQKIPDLSNSAPSAQHE